MANCIDDFVYNEMNRRYKLSGNIAFIHSTYDLFIVLIGSYITYTVSLHLYSIILKIN